MTKTLTVEQIKVRSAMPVAQFPGVDPDPTDFGNVRVCNPDPTDRCHTRPACNSDPIDTCI